MSRRARLALALVSVLLTACECGRPPLSASRSELAIEPAWLDFGAVVLGRAAEQSLTLSSAGAASLTVEALTLVGAQAAAFEVSPAPSGALSSGDAVVLTVRFTPPAPGVFAAQLLVRSDADNARELAVSLSGRAVEADLCEGVQCATPPGPCHAAVGSCVAGACQYALKGAGAACDDGNACTTGDRCGVAADCLGEALRCDTPPAAGCLDPATRLVFEAVGACGPQGDCAYRSRAQPCDAPPAASCLDATTRRTWAAAGRCEDAGTCRYEATSESCPLGCDAGACQLDCPAGEHRCGAGCVSDALPTSCGAACSPCTAPLHATSSCVAGRCEFTCEPGFVTCGSACCAIASSGVVSASLGVYHSCALLAEGAVKCWGRNSVGQLGDGTQLDRLAPTAVAGLAGVTQLACRAQHSCAVTDGGLAWCWGYNQGGRLGDGTTVDRASPTGVVGLDGGVAEVLPSGFHSCARLVSGRVRCWGNNTGNALGNADAGNSSAVPVEVPGLAGVTALSAGHSVTFAFSDGGWTGWGDALAVAGVTTGLRGVVAGHDHACGLTDAGVARCWGANQYGQLGDNTTTDARFSPVTVSGLGGATQLTAGLQFSCALADGGVWCWGQNTKGQLGSGTTPSSVPVPVPGLSGVKALFTGHSHACALTGSGELWCWGDNGSGQAGSGSTSVSAPPTRVTGL